MKQFPFYKRGRNYKASILEYHNLRYCSDCELVYFIEDFYKGQYICKECDNKGIRTPYRAKRRAKLLQACPEWSDLKSIKQIYIDCPYDKQVDHIIPLQGKYICGLHVPENLQYLTASENSSKNNYHISEEYWKDESTFVNAPKIQFKFNRFWN